MASPRVWLASLHMDTVLTECLTCDAMIETATGLEGVAQMEKAGWEAVSGLDWICPECGKSRAELLGADEL